MKTLIRNAVYIGDDIAGFRCIQCNQVVTSMFGDICNSCYRANEGIREQLKIMREINENIEKAEKEGNQHLEDKERRE